MQEVKEFLRACDIFFIATDEGGQPRVRPFGALAEFEQKLYICTNNTKPCFAQMLANPKVEICAMGPDRPVAAPDRRGHPRHPPGGQGRHAGAVPRPAPDVQ